MLAPNTHALHRKPPKASKNSTPILYRTPPNCEPNLLQKRCFSGWRTVRLEPLKSIGNRTPASPTKAYKSTRYTHTNHLKPQKTPLHEMPAPNTHALYRKPPKASKNSTAIFARTPPNSILLQKRCFSGWRTVRLEPLKSISKTYSTSQQ